ncbi:ROK family protein [Lachnospiraceae bacterium WCA-9-b2]|mgnify:FL=1|uniref:ROK family protein n=1 Tax=Sporofaciens musculi TaxID=2681861 RepID=A0A7X3SHW9_9FIRM|nr:ROK family transcriptional regulator [Sporofaciens musculi]MXP74814.1 ROK family protein [Sporofaciens musculi]
MKRGTNSLEVKKLNRNRVFRYVHSQSETSMPDISSALDISGPTVLTIINELKSAGVVKEVGELKSTGGRKAKAIASVRDVRYAVGMDITKNHVGFVYTDLDRKALEHERIRKPFRYEELYFQELAELLREFIVRNRIPEEKIEGVGIALPGIVDRQKNLLTDSHVLGIKEVSMEKWAAYIPYSCELLNDANAAAITEDVCCKRYDSNMIYLSLSNSVGGAVIFADEIKSNGGTEVSTENASMYMGNNWRSGEFGHMVIHPEGKMCYCGKKGCLDAYCSASNLAKLEDGNLRAFFEKMESGREEYRQLWNEYLSDLSIAVDNLRMCFDCEVVLGGYVGNYMGPYIGQLKDLVANKNIFGGSGEYVRVCGCREEASAYGAALYQIEKYISKI